MSNSRKFRRQLEKSPYVQGKLQEQYKDFVRTEAKNKILFGEGVIYMILKAYGEYKKDISS